MSELDEIRRKKLEEMQQDVQGQLEEEMKVKQQFEALENLVKGRLTKDALERYGNIRTAHPEKAVQLLLILGQAIQEGRVETINDEMLKGILEEMTPKKREFTIKRK